jgi:hypothetical protein
MHASLVSFACALERLLFGPALSRHASSSSSSFSPPPHRHCRPCCCCCCTERLTWWMAVSLLGIVMAALIKVANEVRGEEEEARD